MRKKRLIFIITICLLGINLTSLSYGETDTREVVVFEYYYTNLCEVCEDTENTINMYLEKIHQESMAYRVVIRDYNVVYEEDYQRFIKRCEQYNIPLDQRDTPMLLAGEQYYYGQEAIITGLAEIGEGISEGNIPVLMSSDMENGDALISNQFHSFTLANVFVAGLVNGLNPCSLSMLLFLISLLLSKADVKVLKVGMSFVVGKFIAYVLLGTFFYNIMDTIEMDRYQWIVKIVLSLFIFTLAFLNIYDYFMTKDEKYGEVKNQLPTGLRRVNHKLIKMITNVNSGLGLIIAGFILGLVISVGEFLCTGQVYLTTIVYMYQKHGGQGMAALSWLMIYGLGFILPITILIIIISKTKNLFSLSEKIRLNMKNIKLITALFLIFIGIITWIL